jgi:hypothetical protein
MTLNITILSPSAIHQSADFQLSDLKKDADGNWEMREPNAPKIVALRFQRWSGLLTYCGMGKWDGVRTDQRVSEWLSCIGKDATFDGVVQTVRRRGSLWIAEINRSTKKIQPHSFVLAGFEEGNLRFAIMEAGSGAHMRDVSNAANLPARAEASLRSRLVKRRRKCL